MVQVFNFKCYNLNYYRRFIPLGGSMVDVRFLSSWIQTKKWDFYVTRRMSWFLQSVQIACTTKEVQEKYLGFSVPTENYLILNGDEYACDEDVERIDETFDKLFRDDLHFFDKFADKVYQIAEDTNKCRENIEKYDIYGFYDNYVKSFVPAWMRPDAYLEKRIKKYNIDVFPSEFKLDYLEEPLDLLKIALVFKKRGNFDELLDRHVKNYSWLKDPGGVDDVSFSRDEYMDRINFLVKNKDIGLEIENIKKVRQQNKVDYLNKIKSQHIPKKDLLLCEAARKFVSLRTLATETSDHLFHVARHTLLKKYAEDLGLSSSEIVTMEPGEIVSGDISKIEERLTGYAIIKVGGKMNYVFGDEANKIQNEVSNQFKVDKDNKKDVSVKQIKGNPASLGEIVRGRARVLFSYEEVPCFEKGEILVVTMTTPDYVAAMEKASAFVTDEGGITCHAAIVAREFKVPCIVGTREATKVIKTGDLLEVDANSGIIKILS